MPSDPWLGVELRHQGVSAVIAWPDGTATVLPVDGLSNAGHRSNGSGWPEPDHGPGGVVTAGVPTVVALEQQFRQVAHAVAAVAGVVPGAVTVVVPTGWGARHLPLVRRAAAAAGWGMVDVLPAAVAVGWHLLAGGVRLPPGATVLVCAVDGGCTATVLRRTADAFEVVSSVDGATVAADMSARGVPELAFRDGLVREVVRRAMAGAQLAPGMIDLVCAAGPDADLAVGRGLAAVCGVEPLLVAEPELAGVLGAVQRGPAAGGMLRAVRRGGWLDLVAVVLPALWSLGLFGQFLAGSQRYGPREKLYASGMLLASWGGLAVAATFGLVAGVGGLLLATAARQDATNDHASGLGWVRHRLQAVALAGGALGGTALAAVFALLAASYFDLDPGPLLRWSVLPVLPAAVAVLALAMVVWRRPDVPGGSWPAWLRFPPLAVMAAGTGTLLISFDETGSPWLLQPLAWLLEQWAPSARSTIIGPVGRLGGVCIGAAVALLLVRRPLARLLLGVPLAVLIGVSLAWRVTGAVAVGFALVVAGWWAARAAWLELHPRLRRAPEATQPLPAPGVGGALRPAGGNGSWNGPPHDAAGVGDRPAWGGADVGGSGGDGGMP